MDTREDRAINAFEKRCEVNREPIACHEFEVASASIDWICGSCLWPKDRHLEFIKDDGGAQGMNEDENDR